jgi:hypothetical protein
MIKLSEQDFKLTLKQIEDEVKNDCKNEYQNLHNRYIDLKIEHEELENKYVRLLQDNQILSARLKEYESENEIDKMANNLIKSIKND